MGKIDRFTRELEEGKYDQVDAEPELDTPASPTKEAKDEPLTAMESGLVTSTSADGKEDEDFAPEIADETLDMDTGKMDANGKVGQDFKRIPRSDEISVPPDGNQVMIRTIPPDIGRIKLENVYLYCIQIFKVLTQRSDYEGPRWF